ncbi:hypothetical protein BJ742DRAFT_821419, partial [Cladochytrium replicatum]
MLPPEVLLRVFGFIDTATMVGTATKVNRNWRSIAHSKQLHSNVSFNFPTTPFSMTLLDLGLNLSSGGLQVLDLSSVSKTFRPSEVIRRIDKLVGDYFSKRTEQNRSVSRNFFCNLHTLRFNVNAEPIPLSSLLVLSRNVPALSTLQIAVHLNSLTSQTLNKITKGSRSSQFLSECSGWNDMTLRLAYSQNQKNDGWITVFCDLFSNMLLPVHTVSLDFESLSEKGRFPTELATLIEAMPSLENLSLKGPLQAEKGVEHSLNLVGNLSSLCICSTTIPAHYAKCILDMAAKVQVSLSIECLHRTSSDSIDSILSHLSSLRSLELIIPSLSSEMLLKHLPRYTESLKVLRIKHTDDVDSVIELLVDSAAGRSLTVAIEQSAHSIQPAYSSNVNDADDVRKLLRLTPSSPVPPQPIHWISLELPVTRFVYSWLLLHPLPALRHLKLTSANSKIPIDILSALPKSLRSLALQNPSTFPLSPNLRVLRISSPPIQTIPSYPYLHTLTLHNCPTELLSSLLLPKSVALLPNLHTLTIVADCFSVPFSVSHTLSHLSSLCILGKSTTWHNECVDRLFNDAPRLSRLCTCKNTTRADVKELLRTVAKKRMPDNRVVEFECFYSEGPRDIFEGLQNGMQAFPGRKTEDVEFAKFCLFDAFSS